MLQLPTDEVTYEGYGPGGAAVVVACATADRERTAADLRQLFTRFGGYLGARGSVSYLFNPVGLLQFPAGTALEPLMQAALEAGAEDVLRNADGSIDVLTAPRDCDDVGQALRAAGFTPGHHAVTQRAAALLQPSPDDGQQLRELIQALDTFAGTRGVWVNATLPLEAQS